MATHPNAMLIARLFAALDEHDAEAMATCYRTDKVTFHDIAFDIHEKPRLYGMWRMICEGESGIRVSVKSIEADDLRGEARIVDRYQFGKDTKKGKAGRPIVNEITSRFCFHDGLIEEQTDFCDARTWAEQAIGGLGGWLAGRLRFLRSFTANRKLGRFLREHPDPPSRPSAIAHDR